MTLSRCFYFYIYIELDIQGLLVYYASAPLYELTKIKI